MSLVPLLLILPHVGFWFIFLRDFPYPYQHPRLIHFQIHLFVFRCCHLPNLILTTNTYEPPIFCLQIATLNQESPTSSSGGLRYPVLLSVSTRVALSVNKNDTISYHKRLMIFSTPYVPRLLQSHTTHVYKYGRCGLQ